MWQYVYRISTNQYCMSTTLNISKQTLININQSIIEPDTITLFDNDSFKTVRLIIPKFIADQTIYAFFVFLNNYGRICCTIFFTKNYRVLNQISICVESIVKIMTKLTYYFRFCLRLSQMVLISHTFFFYHVFFKRHGGFYKKIIYTSITDIIQNKQIQNPGDI
jgi:hypothetical protein